MEKDHFVAIEKREDALDDIEHKFALLNEEASHLREDNFHM